MVSTKGDVYSLGMTIPEVGSCLFFCSYYQELNVFELLTHQVPYANIKKISQVVAKNWESRYRKTNVLSSVV